MADMKEYIGVKVVHASPASRPDRAGGLGYDIKYADGYASWSPAAAFEDAYVEVPAGQGANLKGLAAMALIGGLAMLSAGQEITPDTIVPFTNDNPSNAEAGVLSDDMIIGIAKVAHEVNREWQVYCGEMPSPRWDACSDMLRNSVISGVRHKAENPDATPAQMHIAWLNYKEQEGWTYGPEKSEAKKTHPQMVPYSQLPKEQKFKDLLFTTIVKALLY